MSLTASSGIIYSTSFSCIPVEVVVGTQQVDLELLSELQVQGQSSLAL